MSTFDAASFLDSSVEGTNDTKKVPIPVGEYTAVLTKVDARQWQGKADPSKSGLALDLIWEIDDANVKAALGRDKVTCKQGIMLDLTDSGALDMGKGKNIGLGRLREATGLNEPGRAFSFSQLNGRIARVKVTHRIEGEDLFDEIRSVAKLS